MLPNYDIVSTADLRTLLAALRAEPPALAGEVVERALLAFRESLVFGRVAAMDQASFDAADMTAMRAAIATLPLSGGPLPEEVFSSSGSKPDPSIALEGWVLVPREPTDAMIKAIEFAIYRYSDCNVRDAERGAPYAYTAMLAAAPPPPTEASPQSDGGKT